MFNRIQNLPKSGNRIRKPRSQRSPQPGAAPAGFVAMSSTASSPEQLVWQQWLYQRALAEAQRVVFPSWLEREPPGTWN